MSLHNYDLQLILYLLQLILSSNLFFLLILIFYNLPNKIDYLSCDIDPQEKTFIALKKVFQDGIEPKLITFETDKYREKIDYEKLAIDFLYPNNYIVAVKDVYSGLKKNKVFETWFINKNIKFNHMNYEEWVKKY